MTLTDTKPVGLHRNRWNLVEDRGTLWTLLGPHGTFLNITETHRTSSNLTELWRLLDGVLDLPEHFWCFFGGESLIFRYFPEHVQELCERSSFFQTIGKPSRVVEGYFVLGLMVPAERSGALSTESYDVCQNCATFLDIKEHGGLLF